MKKVWFLVAAIGLVLCSVAWIAGLVLGDSWLYDEQSAEDEIRLSEMTEYLESAPLDAAIVSRFEQEFEARLSILDSPIEGLGDVELNLDAEQNETFDIDDAEGYLLELEDGTLVEVYYQSSELPFFTRAELAHWLLQMLAVLSTLGIASLLVNHRLQQLNGLTRDPAFSDHKQQAVDPIENAMQALQHARSHIDTLNVERADALNDHRELLASVAHEFRNPLARLQFANEMAMDKSGEEQKGLLEEANHAAVELDELVRETLSYSRLSGQEMAQSVERLSVTDLFREIAASPQVVSSTINMNIRYPENDMFILANRKLFVRALTNLIGNALRYAGANVLLSVECQEKVLLFKVLDDGAGIPSIHHERIFEPFYRVERSRSRESGGFGLGLSIVKSIVQKHGAVISLSSPIPNDDLPTNNSGTCFIIEWELVDE